MDNSRLLGKIIINPESCPTFLQTPHNYENYGQKAFVRTNPNATIGIR